MKKLRKPIALLLMVPALGLPVVPAFALSVEVGDTHLDSVVAGCVNVEGEYEGFRIEPTEPGTSAKICAGSGRRNSLRFEDTTIVATAASTEPRTIRFEHDFSSGPKGLVYATVQLQGFFAQATGVGTPTGSRVAFEGAFSQGGSSETIGERLEQVVGDNLESALVALVSRAEYVMSGGRKLAGLLEFTFHQPGDKLVLEQGSEIVFDNVRRQQD